MSCTMLQGLCLTSVSLLVLRPRIALSATRLHPSRPAPGLTPDRVVFECECRLFQVASGLGQYPFSYLTFSDFRTSSSTYYPPPPDRSFPLHGYIRRRSSSPFDGSEKSPTDGSSGPAERPKDYAVQEQHSSPETIPCTHFSRSSLRRISLRRPTSLRLLTSVSVHRMSSIAPVADCFTAESVPSNVL